MGNILAYKSTIAGLLVALMLAGTASPAVAAKEWGDFRLKGCDVLGDGYVVGVYESVLWGIPENESWALACHKQEAHVPINRPHDPTSTVYFDSPIHCAKATIGLTLSAIGLALGAIANLVVPWVAPGMTIIIATVGGTTITLTKAVGVTGLALSGTGLTLNATGDGAFNMWGHFYVKNAPACVHEYTQLSGFCTHPGSYLLGGDFDGDNNLDVLCYDTSGWKWIVYAGTNSDWAVSWAKHDGWCVHPGSKIRLGDFNGDGRDDLVCHDTTGANWVRLTDSQNHLGDTSWSNVGWCGHPGAQLFVGDYNGDNIADLQCKDINGVAGTLYSTSTGVLHP